MCLQMLHNAATDYFLMTRFAAFLAGAAALTAGFALVAAGAGAATETATTFNAARWSRSVLISAPSLSLRSVSLAMFALIFAMVLAVLDTGAFLATAFTKGLTTFAGFFVFAFTEALVAAFFAVAILNFFLYLTGAGFCASPLLSQDYKHALQSRPNLHQRLPTRCIFKRKYP